MKERKLYSASIKCYILNIQVKNMKALYLGIDGGGTGTTVCLIDENQEVLFMAEGKRSSVDTVSFDESFENIKEVLDTNTLKDYFIQSIFAGVGGIVTDEDKEQLSSRLAHLKGVTEHTLITVGNDVLNALASGLIFDDGMTLIVGTGMAAFGQHKLRTHKAGGWGYKEGDAGSSYDLGFQAVKKAIRAKDFRIPATDFTKEVSRKIGLNIASDIVPIMNNLSQQRTQMASLAPLVTKHANLGDPHALDIVNLATTELMLCVKAIYETLKFNQTTLVVVGSLGNAEGVFNDLLQKKIKSISDKIEITGPKVDPGLAAAILAKKHFIDK